MFASDSDTDCTLLILGCAFTSKGDVQVIVQHHSSENQSILYSFLVANTSLWKGNVFRKYQLQVCTGLHCISSSQAERFLNSVSGHSLVSSWVPYQTPLLWDTITAIVGGIISSIMDNGMVSILFSISEVMEHWWSQSMFYSKLS